MRVEPNHVYVIPPDADIDDRRASCSRLRRAARRAAHAAPADRLLLRSLAAARGSHAIGVVLSGTASDGTEGLRAIKAGERHHARAGSRGRRSSAACPQSAIEAGVVDFVPADAAARPGARAPEPPPLRRRDGRRRAAPGDDATMTSRSSGSSPWCAAPSASTSASTSRPPSSGGSPAGWRCAAWSGARTTWSSSSGTPTRSVPSTRTSSSTSPLLPGSEVFEALKKQVFPEILRHKAEGGADPDLGRGCSTGEEVYSLASRCSSSWATPAPAPDPDLRLGRQRAGHREGPRAASTPTARCAT